jgi:hypothetical protein
MNTALHGLLMLFAMTAASAAAEPALKLVEVRKIWDQAPHNAFTDLVRFQDRWFCVFREGNKHASPEGALRVITSTDGRTWESAALLTSPISDLRDAKINVTPDGQLMLSGAEALHDKSQKTHQSLAWFSKDGRTWSPRMDVGDPNVWLWRVTWHAGKAYGLGYSVADDKFVRLYESADGKTYRPLVERLRDEGYPNESSIVFVGDTAYCLLRRDGKPNTGLLGTAKPPYTDWTWKDLGTRIGGPHMVQMPDGRFLACVRLYDNKVRTSLCWVDVEHGKITEALALPSGGDTSYAGLVLHDGLVWVSYYSSHEGKTSIYLAQVAVGDSPAVSDVRPIGSRRELFVDDFLIASKSNAELTQHPPTPHDVAIVCDTPWEGNTSAYYTLFQDGDKYRMYYRGAHYNVETKKATHPEVTCYAESRDGLTWTKPQLGLFEFQGSKANNIVWMASDDTTHNFTPFKDENPACRPEAKYKALGGERPGLRAFQSADGIHWSLMQADAVITKGAFDSQNLAFWHPVLGKYVDYHRVFRNKVRDILTATSDDFIHWTDPVPLEIDGGPQEHLYTNAIRPYFRAPHLSIGFPTRFQPKNQQVEPILMTSRDGLHFHKWAEPLIPITAPKDRDGNRSNYLANGLLALPSEPDRLSVYGTEAYYAGPGSRLRRFSFRVDGFVSLHTGETAGEVVTHPLSVPGKALSLNVAVAKGGSLQVELQDAAGQPLPGFALADCPKITADAVDHRVTWKKGSDLSAVVGQPLRLRFVMQNADLYALQFMP